MRCFITGATGFVGANLLSALIDRNHEVRALIRPGSWNAGLDGADFERVNGDLGDRTTLEKAMRGCDWCFHVAASYHLWLPDYRPMYAANVAGTRQVIEAAANAGVSRIVYTSTVGCIGLPGKDESGRIIPTNEDTPVREDQMRNHYKLSKWRAELVARELADKGLPVVIVNPSAPVGPCDSKPTPTGQVILDFLHRRMPAYLDTGLNWVDVRDVAIGHILAAERGRVGERYILGNISGNWTMRETFETLSKLTGIPGPRFQVPYALALAAAYGSEAISSITRRPPKAPIAGVRMAAYKMFFDPTKAIQELGMPQTQPEIAFEFAIEWFRSHGCVGKET